MEIYNKKITFKWFYKKILSLKIQKKIYIAYSGGMDSSVLLHLSSILKKKCLFNIKVINVNNKYNRYSFRWNFFCKLQCEKYRIPIIDFFYKNKSNNKNIENYFRKIRFNIFMNILNKNSSLILAHNSDDFLETVLFRIFRGVGIVGLSGLREKRKIYHLNILRPLLNINRNFIYNYVKKNKLNYIIDFSNFNYCFSRNYIRYEILPLISKYWSGIKKSVNNFSMVCYNISNYIDARCNFFLTSKGIFKNSLSIEYLIKIPDFLKYEIIRLWIKYNNYKLPTFIHLKEIKKILFSKNTNKSKLKIDNYVIKKFKRYLYIEKYFYENVYKKILCFFYRYKKKYLLNKYFYFIKKKILQKNNISEHNSYNYIIIKYNKIIIIMCGLHVSRLYNIQFLIKILN